MMLELLYRSRCWLALALIALLAACNVKSDMEIGRMMMDLNGLETRTTAYLDTGCMYWEQGRYDSAMVALNEAIVLAKASEDEALIEKVQQTIAELHSDLDRSEEMMEGYLKRRNLLIFLAIAIAAAVAVLVWLLYKASKKRQELTALSTSLEELQSECDALTETNRDNLFEKTAMIYKIFCIGEGKNIDETTFKKMKSSVCGNNVDTAYEGIFDAYNQVYPETVQRIREHQPTLTEAEFRVCILSMMPFSVKEVADILKVSPAMIGKSRTGIRKKFGMTEARGSIEEFVNQNL
jgi:DNA-binding CsgD family transcriptional regulator